VAVVAAFLIMALVAVAVLVGHALFHSRLLQPTFQSQLELAGSAGQVIQAEAMAEPVRLATT
jgi:hypothetical protein